MKRCSASRSTIPTGNFSNIVRQRISLARTASSAFLRSVKSNTKAAPSLDIPSNVAAPTSTRDAAAVFPEVLFLMRLGGSGRLQLRHTSVVSSAPLGRRQFPPSQSTPAEIVAAVSHDAEESFVRVYNPTIEMPDEDPHNVGVD